MFYHAFYPRDSQGPSEGAETDGSPSIVGESSKRRIKNHLKTKH